MTDLGSPIDTRGWPGLPGFAMLVLVLAGCTTAPLDPDGNNDSAQTDGQTTSLGNATQTTVDENIFRLEGCRSFGIRSDLPMTFAPPPPRPNWTQAGPGGAIRYVFFDCSRVGLGDYEVADVGLVFEEHGFISAADACFGARANQIMVLWSAWLTDERLATKLAGEWSVPRIVANVVGPAGVTNQTAITHWTADAGNGRHIEADGAQIATGGPSGMANYRYVRPHGEHGLGVLDIQRFGSDHLANPPVALAEVGPGRLYGQQVGNRMVGLTDQYHQSNVEGSLFLFDDAECQHPAT